MKRGTQINNKTRARALHFTSRAMTFSLARLILLSVWTLSCDDDSASIRRRHLAVAPGTSYGRFGGRYSDIHEKG